MMRYPVTGPEVVQAMALTSMFVKYMQIELTTNSANLEEIESLLRLLSLLFRTVGEPPFMTSLRIIWW